MRCVVPNCKQKNFFIQRPVSFTLYPPRQCTSSRESPLQNGLATRYVFFDHDHRRNSSFLCTHRLVVEGQALFTRRKPSWREERGGSRSNNQDLRTTQRSVKKQKPATSVFWYTVPRFLVSVDCKTCNTETCTNVHVASHENQNIGEMGGLTL